MEIVTASQPNFDILVDRTLTTINSKSQRIYRQTYHLWADWSHNHGVDFLDMNAGTVTAFLHDQHVTKATRHRQLSAIRKLAKMLTVLDYQNPARKAAYDSLMMVVAPDSGYGTERDRTALSTEDVSKVAAVWSGDKPLALRNRALILTLLYTGLRRAEVATLKWGYFELDKGTIYIPHGKGNKKRDVAILSDIAIDALGNWFTALNGTTDGDWYTYAFPALRKDGSVIADKPMTTDGVYYVVKQTSKLSGVDFAPHDLRRTVITSALENGTPIADVQAQAGHANEATTLGYAQAADAQRRRKTMRLGY